MDRDRPYGPIFNSLAAKVRGAIARAVEELELEQSAFANFRSTLIWEGEFSGQE
jgi:hypothetical protein